MNWPVLHMSLPVLLEVPNEILAAILSLLDIKDIIRLRSVSCFRCVPFDHYLICGYQSGLQTPLCPHSKSISMGPSRTRNRQEACAVRLYVSSGAHVGGAA
jgi:hypothetical protein